MERRTGYGDVSELEFLRKIQALALPEQGTVMVAGGQEPKRGGRIVRQYKLVGKVLFQYIVMHDLAALDYDLLTLQVAESLDIMVVFAYEDGMVDNRMGNGEIHKPGPLCRVEHACYDIDVVGFEGAAYL